MKSYKKRLNDITTFIFDVDGVLTDGSISLLKNEMVRTFNSKDGYAIQYASKMGYRVFIITGGNSKQVESTLSNLGVTEIFMKSYNKLKVYNDIKSKYNINDKNVVYMGDDIPDYKVMQVVGLSACPQDAATEIKEVSHYQSPFKGGRNCVRDIIEQVLRVQKNWFTESAFEW
ncbi:MAG: 3-deoxy-D-manno-octulosonate 8-phosphate phosphatase [Crocinitomicaceae bacterium]|nr:3-deoxy-D-manno-octulosonate 8-phosphate phosphatase [Crocinitomicaceae bacterium]|tara:strand:- start:43643 stop:44161 length:519 start_codon:yes stop_codon:yes gene_type:complete